MNNFRIIQITDLHIGFEGENTRNVDVRRNFQKVLESVLNSHPNIIVITGDICYKAPYQEIYDWVKSIIDQIEIPVYIIPGNHDDSSMIDEKYLPAPMDKNNQQYFSISKDQCELIFLDSASAQMGELQWSWLENELNSNDNQYSNENKNRSPKIIFMHHPPIKCGAPFMDKLHSFKQGKRFVDIMNKVTDSRVYIFCGHYHIDKNIYLNNFSVHITPSCFFQIKQDEEEFAVDHYRVGYRVIDISRNRLTHYMEYVD